MALAEEPGRLPSSHVHASHLRTFPPSKEIIISSGKSQLGNDNAVLANSHDRDPILTLEVAAFQVPMISTMRVCTLLRGKGHLNDIPVAARTFHSFQKNIRLFLLPAIRETLIT